MTLPQQGFVAIIVGIAESCAFSARIERLNFAEFQTFDFRPSEFSRSWNFRRRLAESNPLLLDRTLRFTDLLVVCCLLVVGGAVTYFLSTQPVAFQKVMALATTPARESDWESGPALDLKGFIGSIPFRGSERVNLVRPSQLYQVCIREGQGNCANKSRGLSWFLTNEGMPFQRLDLLPIDGFLEGKGHTLVRTRYSIDGQVRVGVIDLLEGGVPTLRYQPIDLRDLQSAAPYSLGLLTFSPRVDDRSDYYGSFLENLAIGVVEGPQVSRYLQFLERWHVDFGRPSYERIAYAAFAIVIGIFPETHVTTDQYEAMRASAPWTFRTAHTLTWCARALIVLLPFAFALHAVRWVRRGRAARIVRREPSGATAAQ